MKRVYLGSDCDSGSRPLWRPHPKLKPPPPPPSWGGGGISLLSVLSVSVRVSQLAAYSPGGRTQETHDVIRHCLGLHSVHTIFPMMMNIIFLLLVYSLLAHRSQQQPNQVNHPFMLKLLLDSKRSVTSKSNDDYDSGYFDKSDRDISKASDTIDSADNIEMTSEAQILSTVFIGVTTTGRYHKSRLDPILETWHPGLADRTWFFTDTLDPELAAAVGESHLLVLPHCGSDHSRDALACKMEAQLAAFLNSPPAADPGGQSPAAWFCHVDDDNYVNRRTLAGLLGRRNGHTEDWYLGKASVPEPLELPQISASPAPVRRFWFATGGAGFCLSRHLAERMRPWIVEGRFRQLAKAIRLPDDVTVGYLVEVLLGGRLTHVAALHSHLEPLQGLGPPEVAAAITLSYGRYEDTGAENVVAVEGEGEGKEDRTRFRAVHCRLRPTECRRPLG
jgi:fringe protein